MAQISTSILSIKDNFIDNIKKIDNTSTDYIHLDIMDGNFVPNKSFSYEEMLSVKKNTTKPLDVHLMVSNPEPYINNYKNLNPEYITIHYEIEDYLKYINIIKDLNIKAGISVKPNTNIEEIFDVLHKLDLVLIMSVEPGLGGQKFIESSIDKIKKLKSYIDKNNLDIKIEVDGGINDITSILCIDAGCDILVSGSYITNNENYEEQIKKLRN
ncbi:MAG: ribulose-phosphate 3-epimerase [Bacilli bacterium]|nr:ribulose-phosphate 3-epimerase [Bacilli bacterium]